uniref:EC synthetase n=1 Tax=Arundo donax TaxID=35708 RepID=A0A0A9GWV1_ARUDO
MIYWNVEVSHGLTGMKVTNKDTVRTSFCNHISYKLCSYRFPTLRLPVSPGITKIRDNCSNILSRCSPTGINHDQKLHKIFICWRTSWLHKENITASYTFL